MSALAIAAPVLSTVLVWVMGPAAAHAGYHILCAAAIWRRWDEIKPRLAWTKDCLAWTVILSAVLVSGICVFAQIWDPRVLRPQLVALLFPRGYQPGAFAGAIAFTMLVHTPLEELYWRGAAMKIDESPLFIAVNQVFWFYWLHAGPLYAFIGTRGLWLSLPTVFAGAVWALSAKKTRSLWPAILSHAAVEVALLFGVWRYLRP